MANDKLSKALSKVFLANQLQYHRPGLGPQLYRDLRSTLSDPPSVPLNRFFLEPLAQEPNRR